ncbi:MAG: hypothetical protein JWP46_1676, partial [Modestobacter sp.]|nr:hypothetical protein [Modestobacter sp.]
MRAAAGGVPGRGHGHAVAGQPLVGQPDQRLSLGRQPLDARLGGQPGPDLDRGHRQHGWGADGEVGAGRGQVGGHRTGAVAEVPHHEGAGVAGQPGHRGDVDERAGPVGPLGEDDDGDPLV